MQSGDAFLQHRLALIAPRTAAPHFGVEAFREQPDNK
jgi:hypothetical protein